MLYAWYMLKNKVTALSFVKTILPLTIISILLSADLAFNFAAVNKFAFLGLTVPQGPLTHVLFPKMNWDAESILSAYQAAVNLSFILLITIILTSVYSRQQFRTKDSTTKA